MSAQARCLLEICAGSLRSARAAAQGGAQRIELCQALELGGLTPSPGLLAQVLAAVPLPVLVLLRPRAGDFVYDADDYATLQADLLAAKAAGAAGVVLGVLLPDGQVDVPRTRALVELAAPLPVTFHRAFDLCPNPARALEDVVATGCQRLLTSGGQPSAVAGQATLAALVQQAAGRLTVMPGAGVNAGNANGLLAATGARELHASARRPVPAAPSALAEFDTPRLETDAAEVAALVAALQYCPSVV